MLEHISRISSLLLDCLDKLCGKDRLSALICGFFKALEILLIVLDSINPGLQIFIHLFCGDIIPTIKFIRKTDFILQISFYRIHGGIVFVQDLTHGRLSSIRGFLGAFHGFVESFQGCASSRCRNSGCLDCISIIFLSLCIVFCCISFVLFNSRQVFRTLSIFFLFFRAFINCLLIFLNYLRIPFHFLCTICYAGSCYSSCITICYGSSINTIQT